MEKSKLEEFNHWWIRGKVDPELALPFKRNIFHDVKKHLDKRFIVALTGLRRIGKTTIVYQLIENLMEKINPENILFFSFDESSVAIKDVLESYREIQKKDFREDKVYVFLDEIQKCNGWENEIKKYYDLYPKLKFILTGSESLFIKKKSKETLAGRIFEFVLTPFTFTEFLEFNEIKKTDYKYETKIRSLFLKYVEKGGFPETFTFQSEKDFKEYIHALVVDKIVYRDIPKRFNIEDPEFLRVLLEIIATNPGMYVEYQSLSKQFNKDRRVIKNYLAYLKESFLIILLGNYRKGSITTLRKKKRAYPSDNGIIRLYKSGIDKAFFGRMVESMVVNVTKAKSFWKNGGEVDIIYKDFPVEVKYQEKIDPEDFRALREFMRKFSKKEALMITKNEEGSRKFQEGTVKLVPAWKWILEN